MLVKTLKAEDGGASEGWLEFVSDWFILSWCQASLVWLTDWLRLSTKCRKYLLKLSFQPKLLCILTEGHHQMPIKSWRGIILLIPLRDKNTLEEASIVGWTVFLSPWSRYYSVEFPNNPWDFNYKSKLNWLISVLVKSVLEVDPRLTVLLVSWLLSSLCPVPDLHYAVSRTQ